jgi:PTH1 family peptidyl-tRNA hydrolase
MTLALTLPLESLMNVSGRSIVQAYRQSLPNPNPSPESPPFIVLADSLSHRPQAVSPKLCGSANGHNGVKSIISAFGGTGFYRLRLGIGTNKGDDHVDAADYVMAPLSRQEREWWTGNGLDAVLKEIYEISLKNGG